MAYFVALVHDSFKDIYSDGNIKIRVIIGLFNIVTIYEDNIFRNKTMIHTDDAFDEIHTLDITKITKTMLKKKNIETTIKLLQVKLDSYKNIFEQPPPYVRNIINKNIKLWEGIFNEQMDWERRGNYKIRINHKIKEKKLSYICDISDLDYYYIAKSLTYDPDFILENNEILAVWKIEFSDGIKITLIQDNIGFPEDTDEWKLYGTPKKGKEITKRLKEMYGGNFSK